MPRIRSIKPEFFDDPDMASELTIEQRLCYIGLWTMCYDNWTMEYDPRRVRRTLFGYDESVTDDMVAEWVDVIVSTGRATRFTHEGRTCLYLTKCAEHQVVNRPSKSPIPHPQEAETHGGLTEDSSMERKGKERKVMSDSESDGDIPEGFQAFYEAYPRHEKRQDAIAAFRDAAWTTDWASLGMYAGQYAERVKRDGIEKKFIPLPATWLRDRRWQDDTPKPKRKDGLSDCDWCGATGRDPDDGEADCFKCGGTGKVRRTA